MNNILVNRAGWTIFLRYFGGTNFIARRNIVPPSQISTLIMTPPLPDLDINVGWRWHHPHTTQFLLFQVERDYATSDKWSLAGARCILAELVTSTITSQKARWALIYDNRMLGAQSEFESPCTTFGAHEGPLKHDESTNKCGVMFMVGVRCIPIKLEKN